MMSKMGRLHVGTSGWRYKHWRPVFYPEQLAQERWLDFYAEHFDAVEVNNTFYRLPQAETFDSWRQRAPEGFLYVLKFSRYGTHIKRLAQPQDSLGTFLERANRLGSLLGPILVQLPPKMEMNLDRLREFLAAAPSDHRWALEFRNPGWLCEPVYEILRQHNAALCIHDLLEDHPRVLTADWVYLRFHGDRNHAGNYSAEHLAQWARFARKQLRANLDVFAFFNNDVGGFAVKNAQDLKEMILR